MSSHLVVVDNADENLFLVGMIKEYFREYEEFVHILHMHSVFLRHMMVYIVGKLLRCLFIHFRYVQTVTMRCAIKSIK